MTRRGDSLALITDCEWAGIGADIADAANAAIASWIHDEIYTKLELPLEAVLNDEFGMAHDESLYPLLGVHEELL